MLQGFGEKALDKADSLSALGATIGGTIPGMEGVWRVQYNPDGTFAGVAPLQRGERCPAK